MGNDGAHLPAAHATQGRALDLPGDIRNRAHHAAADEVLSAAVLALRPMVIQRRISHGVQSRAGGICRSRLFTVTTSLRQRGRDVWAFLEQTWVPHRLGGEMPSLLPDCWGRQDKQPRAWPL